MSIFSDGIHNLREYGWIKGRLGNREIGFCGIGACSNTLDGEFKATNADIAESYLDKWAYQQHGMEFASWNDYEAQDVDEVIGVLKLVGEQYDLDKEGK